MEEQTKKALKEIVSILIGIGVSILSFFIFILLLFSSQRTILFSLLCIFYISIIAFLVLWNRNTSKIVYLILFVPVICIAAGTAVIEYQAYVRKIPTVNEQSFNLSKYIPFVENNLLAKLEEESALKITYNLPVLDGATALFPVYASFVQAVYPEDDYSVLFSPLYSSGTNRAYENLLEHKADIIFCAEPSEAQLMRFNDNGIKLNLIAIGREAFVFFVNKENPVNNLTIENIIGIYSGGIKNWRELNGVSQNIRVFQRPKDSGSQTILEKVMGDIPVISPRRENVSGGMGDIINQVAVYRNFPDAIGYSFLFFFSEMVKNDKIKLLSIDGIYPSKETIQDGSYPFSENFYAIYIDGDGKNRNIELFVEWILSGQGQELIQKTGYIPIKTTF
ncbi:MAG: substrate-binding domain-containing protein [Treponema sp.]|jgi:phosphate transport system substrate-binding protein|nr:substrate-binding domain-containing protein [Treponema sp.]